MHSRPCFLHAPCLSHACPVTATCTRIAGHGTVQARRAGAVHGACTPDARRMQSAPRRACAPRSRGMPRACIPQASRVTFQSNRCPRAASCMHRESPCQRTDCMLHAPPVAFAVQARCRRREVVCMQNACTPHAPSLRSDPARARHMIGRPGAVSLLRSCCRGHGPSGRLPFRTR